MPFGLSMLIVFSKVIKVVHLAGMMDKKKTNGVPFCVPFGVPVFNCIYTTNIDCVSGYRSYISCKNIVYQL